VCAVGLPIEFGDRRHGGHAVECSDVGNRVDEPGTDHDAVIRSLPRGRAE